MDSPKICRVMVLEEADFALLGGKPDASYAGHCHELFRQLDEQTRASGTIFQCVPVSLAEYHRFLSGRRPQPEWLFDYYQAAATETQGADDEFVILTARMVGSKAEAVTLMGEVVRQARTQLTFYLPITEDGQHQTLQDFWEPLLPLIVLEQKMLIESKRKAQ